MSSPTTAKMNKPFVPTTLVRKCLFGTVNHDRVNRDLELKLQQMSQEDTQRWNFIFKTETPLPGRLQWEKNPVDRIAAFYHESSWGQKPCSTTKVYEKTVEIEQDLYSGNRHPTEVTPGPKKRPLSKYSGKTTHNEETTDMLVKKAHVPAKKLCTKMDEIYI